MGILKAIWDFAGVWTFYIALALIVTISITIQTIKGKKKAQTGEDKAKIHKILATVMGDDPYYVPVFATRIDDERNRRLYYFYAIALQEERMVVVPLSFADNVMGYGTPFEIRKEQLREVDPLKKKPEAKKKKGGSLQDFLPVLDRVLDFLSAFRRKLRIKHLELTLILGGGDPCDLAINYGRGWAALGNLVPLLDQAFVIKNRRAS